MTRRRAGRGIAASAAPFGAPVAMGRASLPGATRAAWFWLVLFTLAASVEIFRIGFFADDYHFLDVARRVPLLEALTGRHGVYPWYRPLSRELFFAIVARAGEFSSVAAHLFAIASLMGCAWLLLRLAARFAGRAAPVAPALFVTYGFTRFLAAWASGFQDLLATLLVLLAVSDTLDRHRMRAALWVFLAPLAKETGFIALPLAILAAALGQSERRPRAWMALHALAFAAALALHLLVRASWHGAGTTAVIATSPSDVISAVGQVMTALIGGLPGRDALTFAAAITAALAIAWLVRCVADDSIPRRQRSHGAMPVETTFASISVPHGVLFAMLAAMIGLAPLIVAGSLRLTLAHAYYGYPAAPWLALFAACLMARAPRWTVSVGLPLLVGWNVLALGYRPPDLSRASSWDFKRWDWREAMRLSSISRRLGADLRKVLPSHPESLVVLYSLPFGTFFQTEDGPATREELRDRTVRGYFVNNPPGLVPREKLAILIFDSTRLRLELDRDPVAKRTQDAATSLFIDQPAAAFAFASWGDSAEYASVGSCYLRAAARLLVEGPASYREALARDGLADSTGRMPEQIARADFASEPGLEAVDAAMFRRPLTAATHAALGESLLTHGFTISAGVELRLAADLDRSRLDDRLELAELLIAKGDRDVARAEIERVLVASRAAGSDCATCPGGRARDMKVRLDSSTPR